MSSKTSRPRSTPPGPTGTPAPATANGKSPATNAWSRPLQPKTPAGPPPGMGAPPILRERFLHLTLSMVGQRVTVTQTDGTVLEGIFHTFTPFASQSPQMKNKYVIKACKAIKGGDGIDTGATLIISAEDVSSVFVKSMRLDTKNGREKEDGFRTDVEISGTKDGKGRDLVAAGSAWTTGRADALEEKGRKVAPSGLRGNIGEWDQFKANEQLFNVSASYDENLYTTELDKSQIDSKKKQLAARLAKEIESSTSSNIHIAEERGHVLEGDYDEEDRYSGVLKSSLQPRNPAGAKPPDAAKPKTAPTKPTDAPSSAKSEPAPKVEPAAKPAAQAPKKMNYAEAAAKADAKAALPPGVGTKASVAPAVISPGKNGMEEGESTKKDEKKEEEHTAAASETTSAPEKADAGAKPAPVTPTQPDEAEANEAEKKEEGKAESASGEKKAVATKLNANAKSFTFNPSAKSFTPTFGGAGGESNPIDPNTGLPMGGPGMPHMQGQMQYMHHPGMGQPGMVPVMNAHFAAMRYQGGPYPGMEHQMPMQYPQQPQHVQQQAPASQEGASSSPAPPASGDESEGGQTQPQQPPAQPVPVPYGGGPPGSYYPGMMPRGGPGFHPHHPPQMGPPVGGNPYHPMYGGPMPMPNMQMRGPGGNYYPPMGGMHYPPGAYGGGGMMDDDQGYRGGGRGGRGGGRGQRRNSSRKGSGRGGGRGYYGGGGGSSGRQTPQSNSGMEDGGDGGDSKTSASPVEEPPKPSGDE